MIRFSALSLLFFLGIDCVADEAYRVIAPNGKTQQVICITVDVVGDKVSISQLAPADLPFGPSGVALNAAGDKVIVHKSGKDDTSAATLEIAEDGNLQLIGTSKLSNPSGYTSVDRSGQYFMTVSYGSGAIAVYRLRENGTVGEETQSLQVPRKESHCILTTRDNRFVYIPCVKTNNALYQFAFDEATGRLRQLEPFDAMPPAMFGPRHVAYHPTLPIAYFSNEQQLGVSVYEIGANGQLTDRQHVSTMPRRSPFVQGTRGLHASDLVVSPNGERLYVAVRDFVGKEDSAFTFQVETDGRLRQIARTRVGDIPWKLAISPGGEHLLVSESADHKLSIFKTEEDGALSRVAQIDWGIAARDMVVVASH
ncbi:MAG: lactonase family protein [Rubripirellula sp.]